MQNSLLNLQHLNERSHIDKYKYKYRFTVYSYTAVYLYILPVGGH